MSKELRFQKMNGAGNDFVVIDNREHTWDLTKEQIAQICDRHRGIGADGLLAVELAEQNADYRFRYYNADGGEAEMCGNGARCFGKFIATLDSDESKNTYTFETIAGVLEAEIIGEQVKIAMSDPFDLEMKTQCAVEDFSSDIHFVNTGVPHAVAFSECLQEIDVQSLGAAVRYHERFAPNGTNVNFAEKTGEQAIAIRTYERGVEGETLACGTGMCACAILTHLCYGDASPIAVTVAGGDTLQIAFDVEGERFTNVMMTGPADFVFQGVYMLA